MAKTKFEIPWQSFVDCLSTVLVVVVFFAVILIILVSVLSYTISIRQESKALTEGGLVEAILDAKTDESSLTQELSAREEFVITFDGLDVQPTEEIIEKFNAWVAQRDPNNTRSLYIKQEMTLSTATFTERRTVTFRRYYYMGKHIKNKIGNMGALQVLNIIQGDVDINKMVITFTD